MYHSTLVVVCVSTLTAQGSRHPGRAGTRQTMARAAEIALARSAAPATVSAAASVYVFTDSGYVLAERGSNDAACYVSRSWPTSIEPHCFDAEGAATIMRIHMREVELLHRGVTPDAVEREVDAAIVAGRLRLPRKPALSYMMSAEQRLLSDNGTPVGRWRPHIMIYFPYLESNQPPGAPPDLAAGIITRPGTAQSSIVFAMPEFIAVVRADSPP
jgi:hypothetical protein